MLIILKTCWKMKFLNYLEERSILILYTANLHFSIIDQVPTTGSCEEDFQILIWKNCI